MTESAAARRLDRLLEAVQRADTFEATLEAAVRVVPELLGVTQAALYLLDAIDGRLLPVAASGISSNAIPAFYALAGAPTIPAIRRALDSREPVVARSVLIVPLVSGGQLEGAMTLQTPGHDVEFTPEDVDFTREMALHVAGAICRARHVRDMQVRLKETAARLAVSDALASTLDVIETMRRVAREIGRAIGGDMVGAYLADGAGVALRPVAGYHVPEALVASFLEFPLPIKGAPGHEALWRARRAFWTLDAAADPRLHPEMVRRFPHRSNLVVPMLVKGEPIGAFIVIWWDDARAITPEELRLVEGISEQAAMFAANARLYEMLSERLAFERETRASLERSEQRRAAFQEIVKELAGEMELEPLLALVGRRARELFEADAALISLVEGDDVVVRASAGPPDLASIRTRRPIAESQVGRVIRDRRPYAAPDLALDPAWSGSRLTSTGYRAMLSVPIVLRDEAIGVIGVLHRAPRHHTAEDVRLLTAFAEHAALAVDRAGLRAQRERRLHETERLLAVSQASTSTLDVNEVARRTVREMVLALDGDVGGAWMLADDGTSFVPLAGYHVPPGLLDGIESYALDPQHPLIVEARRLGVPLAFPDSANDPRVDHPILRLLPHRSLLVCPMRLGGETVGGFAVGWLERSHVFTDDELRLVEGMARQAAAGIANARLVAAERRAGERLAASEARYRSLVENLNDVVYVHDLDGVIQEINEAGVRISGYSREQLIGMRVCDFLGPEDLRQAARVLTSMIRGELSAGLFTAEFRRRDGSRRLLECSGRAILRDGKVVGVQGVARDITERRRLEQRQFVLVALSHELATETGLDALLARIASRVRAIMDTDAGLLMLLEGDELVVGAAAGVAPELLQDRLSVATSLTGAVVRDRRPFVCGDLTQHPEWRSAPVVTRLGYRSIVAVPVILQDRILGVLKVLHRTPRSFSHTDVEFLEMLAMQVALAIDNARLLAQTQVRLRETETLLELGQTVMPALDVTERMRLVARSASRAFGADMVTAYLVDADGTQLMPVAGYHIPPSLRETFMQLPIPIAGHPAFGEAWQRRVPSRTLDMANDPRALPEIRARFPARSVVFAPIVIQDRAIGALILVWWHRERVLHPDELRLLGAISRHAALYLENARLYADATEREHEAQELARQARSLTENLDAAEVGRRTVESALSLVGGVVSTFRVLRDRELVLLAWSGDQDWAVHAPLVLESPSGMVVQAALAGRPMWAANVLEAVDYPEELRRRVERVGSCAMLAVPLFFKGELIGVLTIADRVGRVFQPREISLLTTFGDQAAVAFENSRLYGDLRAALQRAEESQLRVVQGERLRALGELASGVAHDFNNVLTIIAGCAETLQVEIADPALARHLDVITKVTFDAAQTVRRIQEFSRKRLARPFRPVSLNELVEEVVEVTRSRWKDAAHARGVHYAMSVVLGDLPMLTGEPSELREALTNIVFNALDAMPNGGTVSLTTGVTGDRVFCAVRDTGIGMPEMVRRRIFDPFFTTKGERGTGLGLSVGYGIVTRHGGDIDVETRLGHGTTFTVRLPVRGMLPSTDLEAAPSASPPRAVRILVVEDEAEVRDVLTTVLSSDGHSVVTCADGESAIAELELGTFDIVITDLGMPGLSGWDVARAVKQRRPETPVAMVTGWSEQIDRAQAGNEGVDYVIAKPFRRADIRGLLAAALGSGR